ncbi:DNA/RNA non-specific endonuclease [Spirulina sp. 06S082]|uniref:DNA/RNA non-specific endonuclease n=1 Tax=Spirulina sp. 06S082 TaxID=3110248 RepID=UPI002B1F0B6D|nr:DNA/RNA non-specific endonuclease [Spirulina sp. 06S082]MEA5471933.1 DNA/RNA non-specific endonuclease [Spirulina sp. 06S082]
MTTRSDSHLTLPQEAALTNGQEYYWGIRAVNERGEVETFTGDFNTRVSTPVGWESPFSSVTVLTHGFSFLYDDTGISDSFRKMAKAIAETSGKGEDERGLILRYHKETGYWVPMTPEGDFVSIADNGGTRKLKPSDENYLQDLQTYMTQNFINQDKPLVILPEWATGGESKVADTGFSEAAADAFYASLVSLDQLLGGDVGERENGEVTHLYDEEGDLIRKHGAIFDSPLHFIGHSRGTVVNSEIIQRLGTDFPEAGGKQESGERDLQMTTLDPHDFRQESLRLPLLDYRDFYEPEVRVWENVTFADNYYQTVGRGLTPNGREIEEADMNMSFNGLPGFEGDLLGVGRPHLRILDWYAGTMDLDLEEVSHEYWDLPGKKALEAGRVYDQLGEESVEDLLAGAIPDEMYWYNAGGSSEGIGTGWFYSVQGGGERPLLAEPQRTEVSFDNTHEDVVRGDYPISTVFNGSFDVGLSDDPDAPVPGWSFHNGGVASSDNPQPPDIVEANSSNPPPPNSPVPNDDFSVTKIENIINSSKGSGAIAGTFEEFNNIKQNSNQVLVLQGDGSTATHNSFVIPDWGNLQFEVFAPFKENVPRTGQLEVTLTVDAFPDKAKNDPSRYIEIPRTIDLANPARGLRDERDTQDVDIVADIIMGNRDKIGFGQAGFETFQIPFQFEQPENLISILGKSATLEFKLNTADGNKTPVFIDNVTFKSKHLDLGNPTNARWDTVRETNPNLLIERPGYVVSYNTETKNPNWVSWELNRSWVNKSYGRERSGSQFIADPFLSTDFLLDTWPQVDGTIFDNPLPGMDRGHLIPDLQRNRTPKDALETYIGTNLIVSIQVLGLH